MSRSETVIFLMEFRFDLGLDAMTGEWFIHTEPRTELQPAEPPMGGGVNGHDVRASDGGDSS